MYIITVNGDRFISACFNETIPNAVFTYSSPTLNSLPASRFPFSFATSTTSSLNLAAYNFSGNYRYFRLPWVIRMLIFKKEKRKSRVKNDFKTRCTEWCNFIKYKKCTRTFQAIGYKGMMQPTQLIFQGQWTHKSQGTVLQSTTDH